ncbi:MAG: SH3 domain-containing protein, partial [Anaerolineae bacterium]|nr:SH3 domain-containing protein [Anaerolineae bacterium]
MHRSRLTALLAVLFVAALALSACNLTDQEETLPTPTPTTQVDSKPTVTINSPANGSEARVNTQVLVTATVRDAVGVTRVQMTANGAPVKTISSETSAGDREKNVILDFTPLVTGDVQLQVIAYRGTVASDPVPLTVRVVSTQATSTNLPAGTSPTQSGPVINPNDPTCRAVPTTGVNFRSGPGTNFNVITQLGTNSVVPVVGRLGDNSWYQLNNFGALGWVSGSLVTLYGSQCSTVPVVAAPATATVQPSQTPQPSATPTITPTITPTPGTPDLVITLFEGPRNLTIPAGQSEITATYTITIQNVGSRRTGEF